MPTNQSRTTCSICGAKRVDKYMFVNRDSLGRKKRYGHRCKYTDRFLQQYCGGVRLLQLTDTPGATDKHQ